MKAYDTIVRLRKIMTWHDEYSAGLQARVELLGVDGFGQGEQSVVALEIREFVLWAALEEVAGNTAVGVYVLDHLRRWLEFAARCKDMGRFQQCLDANSLFENTLKPIRTCDMP